MICDACKRHIDRKYSDSKTVNCLYFHCENKPVCARDDIVDYCFTKSCPDRSKREDYDLVYKDSETGKKTPVYGLFDPRRCGTRNTVETS